jgi:uncharacterized repeat protein (TIGR02543 family)
MSPFLNCITLYHIKVYASYSISDHLFLTQSNLIINIYRYLYSVLFYFFFNIIKEFYPMDKKSRRLTTLLFSLFGLGSLIWFLVRVLEKPNRINYPCMRAAAPMASTFLCWLAGTAISIFFLRNARKYFGKARYATFAACIVAAGVTGAVLLTSNNENAFAQTVGAPNEPLGTAKGAFPGRVVWVHDSRMTDWAGKDQGDGHWYEDGNTDQARVDQAVSKTLQMLSGKSTDAEAWDVFFRYFNQTQGRGNVGYTTGQKIVIKNNLVGCIDISGWGSVDPTTYNMNSSDYMNSSPHVVKALIRQLVNIVHVNQADITVGDPTCLFPNQFYNPIHTEFPNIKFWDARGLFNRTAIVRSNTPLYWSSRPDKDMPVKYTQDYVPQACVDASYLINLANLKSHSYAGITCGAKNYYGTLCRLPSASGYYNLHNDLPSFNPAMGQYRNLVDLLGHNQLGGKTMLFLVDALFEGIHPDDFFPSRWAAAPFNNDWTSSFFGSQDPVAMESMLLDLMQLEGDARNYPKLPGTEDYLREAALANNPPSGIFYDPHHATSTTRLPSLGVFEHWNNPISRLYSRNLNPVSGQGIELLTYDADNAAPVVTITTPVERSFVSPASFNLTVSATDADGSISRVEYYRNGTLIGTSTTGLDYRISVSGLTAGTYTIAAIAFDNRNAIGSNHISLSVTNGVNNPPTVATAASANPGTVTGTTTTLSVLGADDAGEAGLVYTWATTGTVPAPVNFSSNGTNAAKTTIATFSANGSYNFIVTIRDAGNLTVTSTVSVNVNNSNPLVLQSISGAVASSVESGHPETAAYDKNNTTRWSTAYSDPQWIRFDLGSPKSITTVVFDWEVANARNYVLEGSNDASFTTKTTLRTFTGMAATDHRIDSISGLSGSFQYYRMYGTVRNGTWGYSMYEARFYTSNITTNYTLNATGTNGTVSPSSGTYASGAQVTLTPQPAAGYLFTSWSGDATGTANPLTITMNSNKNIIANFTRAYTLTVTTPINGTISPTSGTYASGVTVPLTATPAANYRFVSWGGDASGTNSSTSILMDANKTVSATFAINTYTVTSSTGANGSISPLGNTTVNSGSNACYTITPSAGYEINQILVNGVSVTPVATSYCINNVTSNRTISVSFRPVSSLTKETPAGVLALSTETGHPATNVLDGNNTTTRWSSAYADPQWLRFDMGSQKSITTVVFDWETANARDYVLEGSNDISFTTKTILRTFTGLAATNHRIDSISGLTGTFRYYRMYGTARNGAWGYSIWEARFYSSGTPVTNYNLTVNATNGSVSPNGGTYPENTPVSLTATPAAGYHFVNWTGDITGTSNPVTVTMNSNKTVTANFAINTYTVTASAGVNGSITPTGTSTVPYGANHCYTITPSSGYVIDRILVDGSAVTSATSFCFNSINANHTISVTFKVPTTTYTLSVSAPNGSYTLNPAGGIYDANTVVTVTANPSSPCYTFSGWTGSVSSSTNPISITMNGNKALTANFTQRTYSITASAGANGSITPTSSPNVPCGSNLTFTITPAANFIVDQLLDNGISRTVSNNSYTITNVTAAHTVSVSFRLAGPQLQTVVGDSVSSEENDGGTIRRAAFSYDGNLNTRWSSQYSDPQWIIFDMGSPKSITSIVIDWEAANAKNYIIEGSNDKAFIASKTTLASFDNMSATNHRIDRAINLTGSYRYYRIWCNQRNGTWGYSIWETRFYTGGNGN